MQQQSAEIIAFPMPAISPQERLARALARLDAALADQRAAVETWREQIDALQGSMGKLRQSADVLTHSLSGLAMRNAAAAEEARQLEAWADGKLAE